MPGRDGEQQAAGLVDRLNVADLYPLCCAGWCVQRVVVRPGAVTDVVHGLAVH